MHPQEPDAQIMKMPVGKGLAYNAQVVANGKAGIIVAADVTKDHTDKGQLVPMLEAAQKMTGNSVAETVADAGYFSGEQLAQAQQRNQSVLVSLKELEAEAARSGDFSAWNFQYDGERNCCICPQGEKLVYKGLVKHKAKTYSAHRYHCQSFAQCPVRWECSKSARAGDKSRSIPTMTRSWHKGRSTTWKPISSGLSSGPELSSRSLPGPSTCWDSAVGL